MRYYISIILLTLLLSCKSTSDKDTFAYFGGEIINPKSNFVLFLKDDKVLDTLLLDKNNRFIEKYVDLEEGLYTFKHGIEFQYIYYEPADSILIRLNTWDFDESLVFTGQGSSKNEFLINLFLQNEKEEKSMYQYFVLNENDFQKKIDSLSNERRSIYKEFAKNEVAFTDGFKKLTDNAMHFPLYRLKEVYPFFNKKALKLDKFPTISEGFYDFRENVNFNEVNLVAFYPYQNYIVSHMYHLSHQLKENDSAKNNITINVLNAIVEHIELEDFKNTLLKRITVNDFLLNESTCTINEEILNTFLSNCSDNSYKSQVKKLVNDSQLVVVDEPLHQFEIESHTNGNVNILDVMKDRNTVIYFWSTTFMSSEYLLKRIQYLEKNYPDILFVGINIQSGVEDITKEPNLKKLNINRQFMLTDDSYAHIYLTSEYPRIIIIDDKGIVKNGFTSLNSKSLSSELSKLQKN